MECKQRGADDPRRDGPSGRFVPTSFPPTGRRGRSTYLAPNDAGSNPTPLSVTGHSDPSTRADAESRSRVVPGSMPLSVTGHSHPSTDVGSASAASTLDSARRGRSVAGGRYTIRSGQFETVLARGPDEFRWVYDPSWTTIRSERNEDSTPAVRRTDGI